MMVNVYSTGLLQPNELIVEEAYVQDDGTVTSDMVAGCKVLSTNDLFKKVQLENGRAIVFDMKIHPRTTPSKSS